MTTISGFLIVRGQARWFINNAHQTRDLDIWVSIADGDKPKLQNALIAWAGEHPQHSNRNWTPPLDLRPKLQIAFPENDGVWYMDRAGGLREISTADRIDVLTSLEGMDFDECFKRGAVHEVEGVRIRAMSAADLDNASEHRFRTEGRR
jgi:hypothetical protein